MSNTVESVTFNSPKSVRLFAIFMLFELIFLGVGVIGLGGMFDSFSHKGLWGIEPQDFFVALFGFYMTVLLPTWALKQITLAEENIIIESWCSIFLRLGQKRCVAYESTQRIEWVEVYSWRFWLLDNFVLRVTLNNGRHEQIILSLMGLVNHNEIRTLDTLLKDRLGLKLYPKPLF